MAKTSKRQTANRVTTLGFLASRSASTKIGLLLIGLVGIAAVATGFVLIQDSNNALAAERITCNLQSNGQHRTLKMGDRDPLDGRCVRHLQAALNGLVDPANMPNGRWLATHGVFDAATKAAVIEFQREVLGRAAGPGIDGIVGPQTWNHIFAAGCLGNNPKGSYGPGYRDSKGRLHRAYSRGFIALGRVTVTKTNNGWRDCKVYYF